MRDLGSFWEHFLDGYAPVFTVPSFLLFRELMSAWVLCPGRRTVTRMIRVLRTHARRAHDAYHRWFRAGVWGLPALWRILAQEMVARWAPEGDLSVDVDDTLFHKTGRKVQGAGTFRDAVRSTAKRVAYAWGLNLVVLTLRVTPPWGGEPLGLPINLRLYRKGGPSHIDLAEAMIREAAEWFPDRRLRSCADGAYATLAGRSCPRTDVTSRMRRDAALYAPPPPRKKGQRGRPAKKGRRLPSPEKLARRTRKGWTLAEVNERGRNVPRLLLARPVLWYQVCPDQLVLLVIVRDPAGVQPDDFLFTTDLVASPAAVAGQYAGRWSIEDTFRNVKQCLGGEDPQTWKGQGPERAASLAMWLYASVWHCYIASKGSQASWPSLPWYERKRTASFPDALAGLRRALWRERIFAKSGSQPVTRKIVETLIEVLARAA